ncbi:MAG: hypothetical protein ICV51_20380 [Flavisolibacter sp.]|nr:hypothetical protein [Flavisolibacter sp.]MBD0284968.1 hypothetical protein [Flavisolibacter sp.]MBD0377972.1 hypothetical protein [Flavisolibacter sp.]
MKKNIVIVAASLLLSFLTHAQHEHHMPAKDTSKPKMQMQAKQDTLPHNQQMHNHQMMEHNSGQPHEGGHEHNMSMSHAFSRNLPMTRNGSGTSWLPDNTPMYGYMFHTNKWMYMLHGNVYLRYNKQDLLDKGNRGGSKFDAPNMVMLMGQRNVGKKGLFHFNTMLSLDPVTVGEEGYPLLFQTGETYKGQPLVDRQHPHDLFSELSVSYAHALSPKADVFLYLAYPGEPALGPAAYVHRPSGFFNPDAPLSHHWVDATHITFGVATLGLRYGNWKIEASSFTGREPDENRYDFDKPRFDSWSGRLSYNPTANWALQVSHGFIKEPEALHLGEDVNRTTASATYSARGYGETFTNLTALWGMNKTKGHDAENGLLLEGSHSVKKTTVYGRYEWVQKSIEELNLDEAQFGHDAVFPVHAFTAGASYDIFNIGQTKMALGGQLSFYNPDKRLSNLYGDNPLAGQVYLRIYPRAMGKQSGGFYLPY